MSEKLNKKSSLRNVLLGGVGVLFNILVFMFLRKGLKQYFIGFLVMGCLILTFGVGSYLVATRVFSWDYNSDLSPLYQNASNLLIGFMNPGKLSFLLGVIFAGWVVNKNSRFLAKYQNKREDRFATALELEVNTRASLILACNATCTVLFAFFWTGVMLLLYTKYVETVAGTNDVISTMYYCVPAYAILYFILEHGLCDDIQNMRKTYGIKPARVKVNKLRREKTKLKSRRNSLTRPNGSICLKSHQEHLCHP